MKRTQFLCHSIIPACVRHLMNTFWINTTLCLMTFAVVCGAAISAFGQEVRIVVPNAMGNVEGSDSGVDLDLGALGVSFRVQYIYPVTEFSDLPETHRLITAIAFRPDHSVMEPREVTWPDTEWFLSTTDTSPDAMSTVYSENHGLDQTLVYDGALVLTTQATGPPEGPRDFDYRFELQTPFFYDPDNGNLVVDFIEHIGYSPAFRDDEHNGGMSWLQQAPVTGSPNGALHNYQLILELTFVPLVGGDTFPLDGVTDLDDLNNVRNNFGMGSIDGPPVAGDTYPFDGLVNIDDLNNVRNNFGADGAAAAAAVPEPAGMVLATLGLIVMLCVLGSRVSIGAMPRRGEGM